ncbi:TolC family protein [Spirosoma koreense]
MKQKITNRWIRLDRRLILGLAVGISVQFAGYGQAAAPSSVTTGQKASATPIQTATAEMKLDSLPFDFNQDIANQLIPFEEIYQLALKYSPQVKFEGAVADAQRAAYQLSKLQILQNVNGFANYSTGNQAILSTGTNANDQLGQISNGYRAGVGVSISLHDLFARPQEIRLAKANFESNVQRRRIAEIQLKRELFNLMQDLMLAQKILHIRLRDDQASLASFRIAEVELQKGKITPEAHAYNSNRYAQSRTTVEDSKTQFTKYIYALELLVGVPIYQLKRN